jgi:predicted DsbA family dithiol-disulfide isomerase
MHHRLFEQQSALGAGDLVRHAQALGLDVLAFQQCLADGRHAAAIRRDLAEGQKAGIRATPTFFLGHADPGDPEVRIATMMVGAQPYVSFREAIESLLATAK